MTGITIEVALITDDPFFTHAAYSLIGKDRKTRIWGIAGSFDELHKLIQNKTKLFDVLVCDLDSLLQSCNLAEDIKKLRVKTSHKSPKILCLCEGTLKQISSEAHMFSRLEIDGLIAKSDLDYCLHLAIRAVYEQDITLLSQKTRQLLDHRSNSHVLRPTKEHPGVTDAVWNVALLRIFVGLDNTDISNELYNAEQTIRKYISQTYKALKEEKSYEEVDTEPQFPVNGIPKQDAKRESRELRAFNDISHWWWEERFDFTSRTD